MRAQCRIKRLQALRLIHVCAPTAVGIELQEEEEGVIEAEVDEYDEYDHHRFVMIPLGFSICCRGYYVFAIFCRRPLSTVLVGLNLQVLIRRKEWMVALSLQAFFDCENVRRYPCI